MTLSTLSSSLETTPSAIRRFSFSFSDIAIEPADLELLLGFQPGTVPDPFPEMIAAAFQEGHELFEIQAGYTVIEPVTFHRESFKMEAGGQQFHTGKVVFSQIRKAAQLAFFAGTAGIRISERCHQLYLSGDTVYGYVLDVMGSLVAGKTIDSLAAYIETELRNSRWQISDSYSPGFCEWDVAEQQKLFALLPPGFCGINLSPSSLMTPVKSVSGIIGIGPELERKGSQCRLCSDLSCQFGRFRRGQL
jgi:hypothetical protein